MEPNEIIAQVKAEMGAAGEKIAESMRAANERIAELDAEVKALKATGTEGAFRSAWQEGLTNGKPLVAPPGISPTEVIERGRAAAAAHAGGGVHYVDVGGVQLPVVHKMPKRWGHDVSHDAVMAMRITRCLGAGLQERTGRVSHEAAIRQAKSWGDTDLVRALEYVAEQLESLQSGDAGRRDLAERALGTSTLGSGASLIVPQYSSAIIDYLHPVSVVLGLGVPTIPLTHGTLSMPYFTDAISVSMVGEHSGPNEDSPADQRLNLVRRTMAAVMAMSKELQRESSYDVDAWGAMHMFAAMAAFKDLKLLRGDGSEHSPKGIQYWARLATTDGDSHSFNRSLDAAAVTIATITADALKALRLIEDSKVPQSGLGWVGKARTFYGLMGKRNATSQADIWPELRGGTWYGRPFKRTPQIPQNLAGDASGTGTDNKTELYYGAFGNGLHAQAKSMEIQAYDGGAYKNASGNVVSGISNREIVFAVDDHFDFADTYRGKSFIEIKSVDYGAVA